MFDDLRFLENGDRHSSCKRLHARQGRAGPGHFTLRRLQVKHPVKVLVRLLLVIDRDASDMRTCAQNLGHEKDAGPTFQSSRSCSMGDKTAIRAKPYAGS